MGRDSFREYVLDQLRRLGSVSCRAMFGGHGIYAGDRFFGIVYDGRLYFRTDETTRSDYTTRGMGAFAPNPRQTLVSYYEVPEDVIEDDEALVAWARKAVAAARPAGSRPRRRKNRDVP